MMKTKMILKPLKYHRGILLFAVTILIVFGHAAGRRYVNCFQCNVYNQGNLDVCGLSVLEKYNCTGCLKTYTRAYLHDRWLSYKYVSYTSKYCMQVRNYELPEGCYTTEGVHSYVRRCYCYSHWCNQGQTTRTNYALLAFLVTAALWRNSVIL